MSFLFHIFANAMKRLIIIILICSLAPAPGWSQRRHALLVGISDYPPESGWSKLHAYNDLEIFRATLLTMDESFQVTELRDASATHDGIVRALLSIASRVKYGDQCIILFSCHGQQLTDIDQDELMGDNPDCYDEAIIPYDAMIAYDWHHSGYKGENHLCDDEINGLLYNIKKAIGPMGQLIVLFDACHSGDMSRVAIEAEDKEDDVRRGTADAFRIPGRKKNRAREYWPSDWVGISACNKDYNNYEVNIEGRWYGRLSYSFCKVFRRGMTPLMLKKTLEDYYRVLPTGANRPMQVLDMDCPADLEQIELLK